MVNNATTLGIISHNDDIVPHRLWLHATQLKNAANDNAKRAQKERQRWRRVRER